MTETQKTKRGRPQGSKNKVPPTPASFWEDAYSGVQRNNATALAASVLELITNLVERLRKRESWEPKKQSVPISESWKYPCDRRVRRVSPWRLAKADGVARQWIAGWLKIVLFNSHAQGTPFAVTANSVDEAVADGECQQRGEIRGVVESMRGDFNALKSHCFGFAQASCDALLAHKGPTFRQLARVIEPQPQRLTDRAKSRHELACRVRLAADEIYAEKLGGIFRRPSAVGRSMPPAWNTRSYRAGIRVSGDEVLRRVLGQTPKEFRTNKPARALRIAVQRIAKQLAVQGGPVIRFDRTRASNSGTK
jgi:hypothetical protein